MKNKQEKKQNTKNLGPGGQIRWAASPFPGLCILSFLLKHRSWVFVRTASMRQRYRVRTICLENSFTTMSSRRKNRFYCFVSLDWGLTSQLTMFRSCRDVYPGWTSNGQSCSRQQRHAPYVEMRTRDLAWFWVYSFLLAHGKQRGRERKKKKKHTSKQRSNQTYWTNTLIGYVWRIMYIYFLALKHRLWVLVRTASMRQLQLFRTIYVFKLLKS